MMLPRLKYVLFAAIIFLSPQLFSQKDSTKSNLSFDLGITRGKNVNLWPVFKKYKSDEKKELDIIYPIFSKRKNYKLNTKHFQFVPFYIADSSSKGIDRRILSTYYPSLLHIRKEPLADSVSGKEVSVNFLELAPHISLFGYSRSPGGVKVENNIFFFIWYRKDALVQRERLVVFPTYWHFANKKDTTNLFFPFYYQKKRANEKHLNVLFLYDRHKTPQKKTNTLFPLFYNKTLYTKNDTVKTNVLFPLYWSVKSRNINNKVLFPLMYSFENEYRKSTTFFPLFTYAKEKNSGRSRFISPVYWQTKSENTTSRGVFPLWWSNERRLIHDTIRSEILFPLIWTYKSNTKSHIITPVYWQKKTENTTSRGMFPLWWSNEKRLAHDTIRRSILFPLVWTYRSDTRSHTVLFPLVYRFKDPYRSSLTVFPLFSYGTSSDSSHNHFVTPIFWHVKNKNTTSNILFPLWWSKETRYKSDTVRRDVLFPLIWTYRSNARNHTIFFPIVYQFKDDYRASLTIFPIFSYGYKADSSRSHLMVTPLFWRTKTRDEVRHVLFPIYWDSKEYLANDTIVKKTLFPIYWVRQSRGYNKQVIFPFVFSHKDKYRQSFTFFPLFSFGHRTDSSMSHLAITPFFWNVKRDNGRSTVFFPLYWNRTEYRKRDTLHHEILFPLYWTFRSSEYNNKIFFPFVWSLENKEHKSLTVFPLFSKGQKKDSTSGHLAVTPLFWRITNKHGATNVLFPLYMNSKHIYSNGDTVRREALFPFYWTYKRSNEENKIFFPFVYSFKDSSRTRLTIFPLVWTYRDKYEHSFTFFPLYSKRETTDGKESRLMITPLYWKKKTKFETFETFFPLYWSKQERYGKDTSTWRVLVPLYFSYRDREVHNQVITPLIYNLNGVFYKSFTFFPFFSKGKSKDSTFEHLAITPLYWQIRNENKRTRIFFPLYWRHDEFLKDDTIRREGVFPIVWTKRSRDEHNTVLFPLVFSYKNPKSESFTVFPFFSHGKNKHREYFAVTPFYWHVKSGRTTRNILFPVFWNRVSHYNFDTVRRTVFFPVYWHNSSTRDQRSSTTLFPLVFSHKDKYRHSFTFFPLFSYGARKDSSRSHLMVTPLFWHLKNKDNINTVLFPLAFGHRNKFKHSFTFFPLFSYGGTNDGRRRHLVITPLFWKNKNENGAGTTLFPLYWSRKNYRLYDTVTTRVLFPLYWSKTSSNESNHVFFPIVYSLKNKERRSFTLFPLFSYAKRTDSTGHLMITPLFWKVKNKTQAGTTLFPLYFSRKEFLRDDTITKRFFFPLFYSIHNKYKKKDVLFPLIWSNRDTAYKSFTFLPLFSFGKGINNGRQHLMITPLFGRFHSKQETNAFLFPVFNYRRTGDEKHFSALLFLLRNTSRPDYSKTSFLWPVCERLKDGNTRKFRFAPVVWYAKTDTSKMFSIQPLFYSFKSKERKTFILSAFLYKRDRIEGVSTSNSFLWRAFYTKRYDNGDFEHRFLHLIIANVKVDGHRERSVLPFYHKTEEKNGDKSVSVFFGFYNHFKQFKTEINDFYEEERVFWFVRLRSNYKKLKSEGKGNFTRRKK